MSPFCFAPALHWTRALKLYVSYTELANTLATIEKVHSEPSGFDLPNFTWLYSADFRMATPVKWQISISL